MGVLDRYGPSPYAEVSGRQKCTAELRRRSLVFFGTCSSIIAVVLVAPLAVAGVGMVMGVVVVIFVC